MTDPADDAVDEILAACLRVSDGDVEDAVERACGEHPEMAAILSRRYDALRSIGIVSARGGDVVEFPERLGDFQLEECLGQGGMGVVFRARQISLSRPVALKLIRPDQLYFPATRERFRREVEAVSRMQHAGIVPVYAVGEEKDLPYFAMELVPGCSLADVVTEFKGRPSDELSGADLLAFVRRENVDESPSEADHLFRGSWPDACLKLVRQVAHALEHAHARGVLHRDIKPSNIMVTPTGRALLLDFGLAQFDDGMELTRSGTAVGSWPYMAPERHEERSDVDERSDVYSLGVVLYELLARESPYRGETPDATRRLILAGRPDPLRPRVRGLSPDAETVCLVAMEREPDRRYGTAADFARDLGNVLEGRPNEARRPGFVVGVWRRLKRRPAVGVAWLLALLLVVGGPLGYAWQTAQANRRLAREHRRAEEHLSLARHAVKEMLARVAGADLVAIPETVALRTKLLTEALAYYEKFLATSSDDPELHVEAARALRLMADIDGALGQLNRAEQRYRRAIAHLEALDVSGELAEEARGELGTCLGHIGAVLVEAGRDVEAVVSCERGLILLDASPSLDDATRRHQLALTTITLSRALRSSNAARARDVVVRALERLRVRPHDSSRQEASLQLELSALEKDSPAQIKALRRARELLNLLLEKSATDPTMRQELAATQTNLGLRLLQSGRSEEARKALETAVAGWRGFIRDFTAVPTARVGLAETLSFLVKAVPGAAGNEARLEEAYALLEELAAEFPSRRDHRRDLAHVTHSFGNHFMTLGRFEEAVPWLERSVATYEELQVSGPDIVIASEYAATLNDLAVSHHRAGRRREALSLVERAIPLQEGALAAEAPPAQARQFLRHHYHTRVRLLIDLRRLEAVASTSAKLADLQPGNASEQHLAGCYLVDAMVIARTSEPAVAEGYAATAIKYFRRAVKAGYRNARGLEKLSGRFDGTATEEAFLDLVDEVDELNDNGADDGRR